MLSDRLKKFEPTISATISRSDQAFLTSSLALQAALGGRQASLATPSQVVQYQEETTTIDGNGNPVIVKTNPQVIAKEKISEQEIPGAASNLNSTPAFSNRNSLLTDSRSGRRHPLPQVSPALGLMDRQHERPVRGKHGGAHASGKRTIQRQTTAEPRASSPPLGGETFAEKTWN